MPIPDRFRCYQVRRDAADDVSAGIQEISADELSAGDVTIGVRYSSLNYKDALAATGHPGVARSLPHVPGIDAAGVIIECSSGRFAVGDEVVVTGYELGSGAWGGWSEYIRVPEDWVVPLSAGLTLDESMTLGTAGFTAAQCVSALQHEGIKPESGPIVVTGATGGVGCLAVGILAKLGYDVTAVSGKSERHVWLKELGANDVVGREAVNDESDRAMLPASWAGAVDTVGGNTLGTLLRSTKHRACVTACGLVSGVELNLTVYPFLLRGVRLIGIDSAHCPMPSRLEIWEKLAGAWKLDVLADLMRHVPLDDVGSAVDEILKGQVAGRCVVDVDSLTPKSPDH